MAVVRRGEKALHAFLSKTRRHCKIDPLEESHGVYLACRDAADLYKLSDSVEMIVKDFLVALQKEISRELRIMEMEQAESADLAKLLEKLYLEVHNLT
ncbi:MAG: hypothetical protein HYX90_05890 [Chloroflexi bacterium]|nr:hypothetical protein [Chloroflexota bacterium]